MNVVIYARFSSSKQNDTSIDASTIRVLSILQKNDYYVVGEYIDRALSGRNDERPDFQRMIRDSAEKKFERNSCISIR